MLELPCSFVNFCQATYMICSPMTKSAFLTLCDSYLLHKFFDAIYGTSVTSQDSYTDNVFFAWVCSEHPSQSAVLLLLDSWMSIIFFF